MTVTVGVSPIQVVPVTHTEPGDRRPTVTVTVAAGTTGRVITVTVELDSGSEPAARRGTGRGHHSVGLAGQAPAARTVAWRQPRGPGRAGQARAASLRRRLTGSPGTRAGRRLGHIGGKSKACTGTNDSGCRANGFMWEKGRNCRS
jgi:hypothetical protein